MTHPLLFVGGPFGSTISHYCSLRSMKKCTKPSLGIKLSIKVENTQFWYIIALIKTSNNQILSFLKILKNPMVLWIFWNTQNWRFFESGIFFSSTRTWWFFDSENFQIPKTHGSLILIFFLKTQNQWVLQNSNTRPQTVNNIIGFVIIEPNSSYPHTICSLLGT